MVRQYTSTTELVGVRIKNEVLTYTGINRVQSGANYQISMGESGAFYCDDLEIGKKELARYCSDHYGWTTNQYPIRVNRLY